MRIPSLKLKKSINILALNELNNRIEKENKSIQVNKQTKY